MNATLTDQAPFEQSATSGRCHPIPTPAWWRGDADRYQELLALRSQIAAMEALPMHMGWAALVGAVVGVLGTANATLAHAMVKAEAMGVDLELVAFAFVLLVAVSLLGCEASLCRRGRSFPLCSALWGRLVSAVTAGMVDEHAIAVWNPGETRIERALRKEIQTAMRYVAAAGTLRPRLNLFASGVFGLTRSDGDHRLRM